MTRNELFYKWEWEGWEYVLTEIDPDHLQDAALAEALSDAQEAFHVLQSLFPTWEEVEGTEMGVEDAGLDSEFEDDIEDDLTW